MKHSLHIFMFLLTFLGLLTTCKNPGIDYNTFTLTETNIHPEAHQVTVTGSFDFSGEVVGLKINIGLDEQLTDAVSHSMSLKNQSFSATIDGLAAATTYYCNLIVEFGDMHQLLTEVSSFTTLAPHTFRINVSCNPSQGGNAEGNGTFAEGVEHLVKASANEHYVFKNWTENGQSLSTSPQYSFVVERNRTLVANFSVKQYHIKATANPENGGTIDGLGDYDYGRSCSLKAIAAEGFVFEKWTENGIEISNSQPTYEFTVVEPRTLVAHFRTIPQVPEGCIKALFSVSPTLQVYFSKGNLQYRASTQTWQFATNQWHQIDANNANISPSYNGWIDLFGWGTGDNPTKYLIGDNYNDFHDWGDNPISNGGNTTRLWRTMTKEEWNYVFYSRLASTVNGTPNARFTKAVVNNVKGVILFPDDYTHPNGIPTPQNINKDEAGFQNNYSISAWSLMEKVGCVFLPITGLRKESDFSSTEEGYYWSTTVNGGAVRVGLFFSNNLLNPVFGTSAFLGESVRLVHDHR